jgi:predicted esterase
VGGWLPPPLLPAAAPEGGGPEIVALHGTDDTVVPYEPTQSAVSALALRGFRVSLRSYPGVAHRIDATMRTDLHELLAEALP